MKRAILTTLLLVGCAVTPKQTAPDAFPSLSKPPLPNDIIVREDIETIKRYYQLLDDYYTYLGGYLDFMALQYALSANDRKLDCLAAIKQNPIRLEALPNIKGMGDEEIVNTLIDHVSSLRQQVNLYNEKVIKHNKTIEEKCS